MVPFCVIHSDSMHSTPPTLRSTCISSSRACLARLKNQNFTCYSLKREFLLGTTCVSSPSSSILLAICPSLVHSPIGLRTFSSIVLYALVFHPPLWFPEVLCLIVQSANHIFLSMVLGVTLSGYLSIWLATFFSEKFHSHSRLLFNISLLVWLVKEKYRSLIPSFLDIARNPSLISTHQYSLVFYE